MRIFPFLLLAAIAATSIAHADSAGDTRRSAEVELQRIADRTYAAMQAADDERTRTQSVSAKTRDAVTHLRTEIANWERLQVQRLPAGDTALDRKRAALSALMASAERAVANGLPTGLPLALPSAQRSHVSATSEHAARTCSQALGLSDGIELDLRLDANDTRWIRFDARGPARYRVTTAATPLDTELAVFASCPKSGSEKPLALADDSYGLAATVGVDLSERPGPRWIRLRNRGLDGATAITGGTSAIVSGHITEEVSGAPIANAFVAFYDSNSIFAAWSTTDESGAYTVTPAAGTYYVLVTAPSHVSELYPDAVCASAIPSPASCDVTQAQTITVADGDMLDGIDVALSKGASIEGIVREAGSGIALPSARVHLYTADGANANVVFADSAGRYKFSALFPATFYVSAAEEAHGQQVFAGVDCAGPTLQACDPLSGTPIAIARDEHARGVDFSLAKLAAIVVHVDVAGENAGVPVDVTVYDTTGAVVTRGNGYSGHDFSVGPLPAGQFYVKAGSYLHYAQLFDRIDCASDCIAELSRGRLVATSPSTTPILTFSLSRYPTMEGVVTDAVTGLPLTSVLVIAFGPLQLNHGSYTTTDSAGRYKLILPPDVYYVVARSSDHADRMYPDALCIDGDAYFSKFGCDFADAVPVAIANGGGDVLGIDFALPQNGSISGRAQFIGAPGQAPIPASNALVTVYDENGTQRAAQFVGADGTYVISDLGSGTYFARLTSLETFPQIFSGINCTDDSCDARTGTPISIATAEFRENVDFAVARIRAIVGRITSAMSGAGAPGVALDLWDAATQTHCGSTSSDVSGYYVLSETDTFCANAVLVSTDAQGPYIDQIFDGVQCPNGSPYFGLCSLSQGTPLPWPATTPQPIIANFILGQRDAIYHDGFEP